MAVFLEILETFVATRLRFLDFWMKDIWVANKLDVGVDSCLLGRLSFNICYALTRNQWILIISCNLDQSNT
jgi:hypothetical protein